MAPHLRDSNSWLSVPEVHMHTSVMLHVNLTRLGLCSLINDKSSSTSGSSTVAIDNKIEQAMDLVKSHLMFAVREEVEVLKERISELMERITFLESENSILRSSASQDTLNQVSQLETATTTSTTTSTSGSSTGGTGGQPSVQNGTPAP